MVDHNTHLASAPALSNLGLPPWILARLTDYFKQKRTYTGIMLVTGSSPERNAACLHSFLAEFAKEPCVSFVFEREARYALPVAPARFTDETHAAWRETNEKEPPSLDDLTVMNTESHSTRQLVHTSEEYASAVRSALRWDPDILLVDDIPDDDTAALVEQASFTGHAVIAGLAQSRAAHTLASLVAGSDRPELIGAAFSFVLAVEPIASSPHAAHELIIMTPEIVELLKTKPSAANLWELALSQGSRSMLDDAKEKAGSGITSTEDLRSFETELTKTVLE